MHTVTLGHVSASHLDVGVAQPQPGSLVKLGGVLEDLHDSQEVAAVLGSFIGGESETRDHLGDTVHALSHLSFAEVVPRLQTKS